MGTPQSRQPPEELGGSKNKCTSLPKLPLGMTIHLGDRKRMEAGGGKGSSNKRSYQNRWTPFESSLQNQLQKIVGFNLTHSEVLVDEIT